MFFKDLTQGTASYQETPKADHVAPVVKRAISWTRFNPSLHAGLRSGKFNLEKIRRSKSDSDNTYNSVTLASVTDLENKNDDRLATTSPLHCQEVLFTSYSQYRHARHTYFCNHRSVDVLFHLDCYPGV